MSELYILGHIAPGQGSGSNLNIDKHVLFEICLYYPCGYVILHTYERIVRGNNNAKLILKLLKL